MTSKEIATKYGYKSRYLRITIRPHNIKRYPNKATEIVFTMPKAHAVQAVEDLMCYMGYGCTQYTIISAEEVSKRYEMV